jgi:hypothetical protein
MSTAAALPGSAATQRMLDGPVLSTLLRLATPNVLGLMANTVVIGFDGYIVGRLGADALAGVAVVLPLAMLMLQMSAGGLGGSTTAVVARALGAGDAVLATRLARHALVLGLLASLLFTLIASGSFLYTAMGARGGVLAQASSYAAVLFAGAAAVWSVNVLASVARGTGAMGAAALALVGTTAMHLVLCPLLVFGAGPVPALSASAAPSRRWWPRTSAHGSPPAPSASRGWVPGWCGRSLVRSASRPRCGRRRGWPCSPPTRVCRPWAAPTCASSAAHTGSSASASHCSSHRRAPGASRGRCWPARHACWS